MRTHPATLRRGDPERRRVVRATPSARAPGPLANRRRRLSV